MNAGAAAALRVTEANGRVRFGVHVQPRASRSAIDGVHGDAMKVRLTAPPVDGAANDELVRLLADSLGVARRDVTIVAGARSRAKVVEIAGLAAEAVRAAVRR